jgi:hypothetical protein
MAENPFKKVGSFVADEMLGLDDFGRVFTKAASGDVSGALKSAAAGALELGSTVLTGGSGTVAKQALKAGAKSAIKTGAKESGEAGVKAGAKSPTFKSSPGPSDLMGQQFQPKAGTITKPKPPVKPTKPGDLPGAPGYPRTPAKPGDLPGAPGYPKPAPKPEPKPEPKPAPAPKPLPKPLPKPAPAPVKPEPAPKPEPKPAVAPKPKPAKGKKPKSSTSTSAKPATNLPKFTRQFSKLSVPTAIGGAYLLGKKSDKKDEGPWNPSAIV